MDYEIKKDIVKSMQPTKVQFEFSNNSFGHKTNKNSNATGASSRVFELPLVDSDEDCNINMEEYYDENG